MRAFWNFLQYNNLVPIALFVLFGGTGVALAATPQVQQAVYSSADEVKGVDNSYLVSADLAHYDFGLRVTSITEDTDSYYIAYAYRTVTLVDYVWKQADVAKTLTLSKKEVQGHDLGLMVAKQLGEEITHEMAYLTEAQQKERKAGVTARSVTTTYSGLIGARLDPTTKEFPTYVPVVAEAKVDSGAPAAAALAAIGVPGESHDALPPPPSQVDIEKLVNDAVSNALANAQNQNQPVATAVDTPPADNPPADTPPADNPPASSGGGGTVTPPADTPPATTTPPVDTPPAATSTPVTTPPATTTPPVSDPAPSSTPTTTPAATPPADQPASTPPADATPPAADASSTPQN